MPPSNKRRILSAKNLINAAAFIRIVYLYLPSYPHTDRLKFHKSILFSRFNDLLLCSKTRWIQMASPWTTANTLAVKPNKENRQAAGVRVDGWKSSDDVGKCKSCLATVQWHLEFCSKFVIIHRQKVKSPLQGRPYSKTFCKCQVVIFLGNLEWVKVLHEEFQKASNELTTTRITLERILYRSLEKIGNRARKKEKRREKRKVN